MQRRTVLLLPSDDCGWPAFKRTLLKLPAIDLTCATEEHANLSLLQATATLHPDVVITATHINGHSTMPLLNELHARASPGSRIVLVSGRLHLDDLMQGHTLGVVTHLLWSDLDLHILPHLLHAIIFSDVVVVSREVAEAFVAGQRLRWCSERESIPQRDEDLSESVLSSRERTVLEWLARDDLTYVQIARELNIGCGTVKSHAKHISEKLGATGRHRLVAVARRRGLLPPETMSSVDDEK